MMQRTFIIVLLLVPMAVVTYGQARDAANVEASVDVVESIEMLTLADINVGTVQPNQGMVILDPRLDSGAGLILLKGRPLSIVSITYTQQVEMVNSITNYSLNVQYDLAGLQVQNQAEAVAFESNPVDAVLGENGEYYVWIGVQFNLNEVSPGQYDGDFVIEVEYP